MTGKLLLIVAVVAAGLIYLAALHRKKKLLARMQGLFNFVQVGVYLKFREAKVPAMGKEGAARQAAALANYLFGKPPSDLHLKTLDMYAVYAEARRELQGDRALRELVVQSLRVAATIEFLKTSKPAFPGADILETFGAEFADAPNPDSYQMLVEQFVAAMPPAVRAGVESYRGRQ